MPTVVESDTDGKVIRIRPFYYDDYVDWESKNPWKIEARGKTFAPPRHTLPGVYYMTYKKRVYSENRVRYPLKRVDWDPNGRAQSAKPRQIEVCRFSWDEATDILAGGSCA
jgi:trimethylamine-N-oxide reductase (cytochrome c)